MSVSAPPTPPPQSFVLNSSWPTFKPSTFFSLKAHEFAIANGFIPTLGRRHDGPNGIHRISCAFDDGHGACPCSAEVTEFGCSGGSTSVSTTSVNLAHSHPPPAVDPAEFETYKQRATPRLENLREFLLEAIEKDFNRLHRAESSREGYENEDPDSSWSLASQAEALVQAYEDAFDYRAAKEMYRSLRKKNYVVSFYGGPDTHRSSSRSQKLLSASSSPSKRRLHRDDDGTTARKRPRVESGSSKDGKNKAAKRASQSGNEAKRAKGKEVDTPSTSTAAAVVQTSAASSAAKQLEELVISDSEDDMDVELEERSGKGSPEERRAKTLNSSRSAQPSKPSSRKVKFDTTVASPSSKGKRPSATPSASKRSPHHPPQGQSLGRSPLALQQQYDRRAGHHDQSSSSSSSSKSSRRRSSSPSALTLPSSVASSPAHAPRKDEAQRQKPSSFFPSSSSRSVKAKPSQPNKSSAPSPPRHIISTSASTSSTALTPLRYYLGTLAAKYAPAWKVKIVQLAEVLSSSVGIDTPAQFESEVWEHPRELVDDLKKRTVPPAVSRQFEGVVEKMRAAKGEEKTKKDGGAMGGRGV